MAGYSGDSMPAMERRMIEAVESIARRKDRGTHQSYPARRRPSRPRMSFTDQTTDLRTANAAATVQVFKISPDYLHAAETSLLAGRSFSWQDDKDAPRVAVVNALFARKIFGSVTNAVGRYFKMEDGTRVQVVGVAEDGKYYQLTEDPRPAMFLPVPAIAFGHDMPGGALGTRTSSWRRRSAAACENSIPVLPLTIMTWTQGLDIALFPSHVATVALGVLGLMGAMLSITGIFGMAAYSVSKRLKELGIRVALGAQTQRSVAGRAGAGVQAAGDRFGGGIASGSSGQPGAGVYCVSGDAARSAGTGGVVLAMALLGLVATWIPAQRALSIDPLALLRED